MANKIQAICLSETIGGKEVSIQSGTLAKQAGGSVTMHLGGTLLLCTATAAKTTKNVNFTPLTAEYRERTYAAGKIPGGFFKREGRPRDKETLYARAIDRPIRPMLHGIDRETMIYALLMSFDGKNDPGPLGITGCSAALLLSDVPFPEPVSAVRVGRLKETQEIVIFPTNEEREKLDLEMIVAGKKGAILMVEGGAAQVPEDVVIEALRLAQIEIDKLCDLQRRLVDEHVKAGRKIEKFKPAERKLPEQFTKLIDERARGEVREILHAGIRGKDPFNARFRALREKLAAEIVEKAKTDSTWAGLEAHVNEAVEGLKGEEGRRMIIEEKRRPDGRALDEVRPISIMAPVLPCTHGSVAFTRGETQAVVTATLGTPGDMQIMDELEGEYKERFLLHYNFPGYSVGEVKPERGPGRREIGHGALARRALLPLLPAEEDFPYTIRIVSDITESNGSSSMASVCGGSLSMFDAGVPLKAACAGVAMGLCMEGDKYSILTDIAGLEDHEGDLDFKVAGTREGVTAVQMDMKVGGISLKILSEALEQAKQGRLHILGKMEEALSQPRKELSPFAPRLIKVMIPVDKIGALIGPGGKNIRRIIEEYGVDVDVEDDGSVFVGGVDAAAVERARSEIEGMTAEPEIGAIYKGRVVSCVEFGAFVEIMPGREGLLHISQIDVNRVERVTDVLKEGQEIEVKVLEVSHEGKIRLSRKAVISPGSEKNDSGPSGGGRDRRPGNGGGGPRRGGREGGRPPHRR